MEQGHGGHPASVRSRVSRVNMDIQDPIVRRRDKRTLQFRPL